MDPDLKAFLEFNSMHQEPWDGPAGVVATNGGIASCSLDRNGLRPARYSITHDGVFTVASETGVWDCPPERIKRRGRLGPGEMIAVDTESGRFWKNNAIDDTLKATRAYREWMTENVIRVRTNDEQERRAADRFMRESSSDLPVFQKMFGLGAEEIETIINPMALESQEPVGSMGDDTPLAVLSGRNRSIYDYFCPGHQSAYRPPQGIGSDVAGNLYWPGTQRIP
jgi:glutamate synthase (NADPH/NADH) large chain